MEQLDGGARAESVRFAASFSENGTLQGVLHVAADSKAMVFLNGIKVSVGHTRKRVGHTW